jgi:hypothetical protein
MKAKKRMSMLNRVLPVCVLLGGGHQALAQEVLWSDPATWPGNKVPAAGDTVEIPSGKQVVLDVTPPVLAGLTINGKLRFSDEADLELSTEWIMLHGELEIGTEAKPYSHKATITLTDNVKDEQLMGMGDRGIMLSGGTLNLHGNRSNSWTKLAATAEAGANSIEVLDASQWQVGDQIVLASTDYDPRQAEVRTIAAINGNSITLDQPLQYMHFGQITFDVDERGEVGMLTRNIKIQASEDAAESHFGGHIMAMVTSKMFIDGVELNRMGQHLELARYPIHWHLVGDGGAGQYIRNSAIHDTFNRCVTVHGTNELRVENNVTYNIVGHCFFMEDGIESGNQFIKNLAIQVKCHPTLPCEPTNLAAAGEATEERQSTAPRGQRSPNVLLPSDNTVASFWITNPDNSYIDNVAAGSDANGFWMSLPEHPNGAFLDSDASKATWPRRTHFREFRGNVAHSSYDGFMFDRNINVDNTFTVTGSSHTGFENPADPASKALVSVFEDLTAYKNRNGGIWGRGGLHLFRNVKFADNAIGFTHAAGGPDLEYSSRVIDSLFVGETENIGNPLTAEEKLAGRSLPKPAVPDFPIRGYEWYDYRHDVMNTTFRNYEDNDIRQTGAISHLLFTSFGASSNNAVEKLTFENAKPVYYPPLEKKWGNDNNAGSLAYKTAVFRDLDGSLGRGANAFVVIHDGVNDSIAVDNEACDIKPDWNAAVCTGDVGRMSFVNGRGLGFGRIAGGFTPNQDQRPIILSRNGTEISIPVGTNVRHGIEFKATTERSELELHMIEMDKGNWVIVELPGFAKADIGTEVSSLNALRSATDTAYYKSGDALWVKLVSPGDSGLGGHSGGVMMQVSR